jgi:hypothetical protein
MRTGRRPTSKLLMMSGKNMQQEKSQPMKLGLESTLSPAELTRLAGSYPIVAFMLENGIPVTRENYLRLDSNEEVEWGPELEEQLPPELQLNPVA